ncbi:MAG TPA: tetratricopeptide repeat protein [Dysgonamonadaceae bacterium]|nr:tetratricopeptide repeat protein [Dysgonamonadaceae bacterium]
MKKIILLLSVLGTLSTISAQKTAHHQMPEKLFHEGKEMFLGENYSGANDLLSEYIQQEEANANLKEEAAYLIAASAFHRNTPNSGDIMKEFLNNYPETLYHHNIKFLIGSYHFNEKEWAKAVFWFNQANLDYLGDSEQEDYSFRLAYAKLQEDNKEEATRLFGLLAQFSEKYHDAGNYYYGYIDYTKGNYNSALSRFQSLQNNLEYKEEVDFYTAQSTFFTEKLEEAIRLSATFVNSYPQSEHLGEIYRILGNSNYRLDRSSQAIPYYERYRQYVDEPLRGDAYFLGLSYLEANKLSEAVEMFQYAIGENDALTQNAQLYLGQTYLKMDDKPKAQMAFAAASRVNFDAKARETAMFNYALLTHQTNFSVFSESITLFENFLREFPNSQYTDQVNDILAETFLTTKDYNAALSAINRIDNPARRILEAKQMVLFQLGTQQFINSKISEAIDFFDKSINLGNYNREARTSAFFWRGESKYRINNFSGASADFQTFTQETSPSNENYALGLYNLGYARFKQNQYAAARTAFQNYINAQTNHDTPEFADAHNRIGDTYYFSRNFADAERYYSSASNLNPASADYAAYQKAFVMGLQNNYNGKIAALDQLMRSYPNSHYYDDALYEKSRALVMLNREDEAVTVLNKLLTDFPQSPLARQGGVQLGQLHYNANRYPQAITAYKAVIQNFPGSEDARSALQSLETVYKDMNDIDSFVKYANSLPGGMRITPLRQDSLTYLAAENLYMRGSKSDAEKSLTKYLQSYPEGAYSSDANYYLGVIADEKSNIDKAMFHFRQVVDANSGRFIEDALSYVAQTEYAQENYQQALQDYARLNNVAQSLSHKQTAQLGIIRANSKLNNYHETARAVDLLLENKNLSPQTITEARYLRGKAYQQVREVDKAMSDFQAIADDTRSIYGAEAQFRLAEAYYNWESYDKAEAQVKEFMQKTTPHQYWLARALIVLSDTYKAKGDNFQARQYLESLQANYKGDEPEIQQMIEERLK